MKKEPDKTSSRKNEHILPVPWDFVMSEFHCTYLPDPGIRQKFNEENAMNRNDKPGNVCTMVKTLSFRTGRKLKT